jgi:hypothetical protein
MSKNVEGLWIITDIYDDDKRGKIRTATTTRGKDSAIRAALRFAKRVEIEHYKVEYIPQARGGVMMHSDEITQYDGLETCSGKIQRLKKERDELAEDVAFYLNSGLGKENVKLQQQRDELAAKVRAGDAVIRALHAERDELAAALEKETTQQNNDLADTMKMCVKLRKQRDALAAALREARDALAGGEVTHAELVLGSALKCEEEKP